MKRRLFCLMLTVSVAVWSSASHAKSKPDDAGGAKPDDDSPAASMLCVNCHKTVTPKVVSDWQLSLHSKSGVSCSNCHGSGHTTFEDVDEVRIPTPDVCAQCHPQRVDEFSRGKHALAWAAMNAMPTTHLLPMALVEGMKGCGACHKLGLKTEEEIQELKDAGEAFGIASCDACHTRHTFFKTEAQQPQACQTCHMGFDHPQWEMYSSSKHGVRHGLQQLDIISDETAAPTCQTCHMQNGDHEVRTPWGFLAVRLPLPEDDQWKADQITILQGLGVLDPDGNPTARLEVVAAADVARLTQEAFDVERQRIVSACSQCHSENFARNELAKGDGMIREIDHLMAEAIRIVAALYEAGLLQKPDSYAYAFPDLLAFHDAPTPIEQRLFVMHLKHRMRAFQGVFHSNPDYALWYGWSEMVRDLSEIREMAVNMGLTLTSASSVAAGEAETAAE